MKRIGFLWSFAIILLVVSLNSYAIEPKRFALLIGNSAYSGGADLKGIPKNDATDLAKTLQSLGFKTRVLVDVDRTAMLNALSEFKQDLKRNPGSIALYYFAGHGVQMSGINYLLPLGNGYKFEDNVKDYGLNTNMILERLQGGRPSTSLIILDACRNNPFEQLWSENRSFRTGRGLAKIAAPSGFMVAYSTQPGHIASNGVNGRNGLYTAALLKHLPTRQIDIYEVFSRVRAEVEKQSRRLHGELQSPREDHALLGDRFYFNSRIGIGKDETELDELAQRVVQRLVPHLSLVTRKPEPNVQPNIQPFIGQSAGNAEEADASPLQMVSSAGAREVMSPNPHRQALAKSMQLYLLTDNNIAQLVKLSKSGNVFAGMMLERAYRLGAEGAPINPATAKQYVEQKVEAYELLPDLVDNVIAMSWLANRLRDSNNKADHAKALELFTTAAERGMPYAQRVLGNLYETGQGVSSKDYQKAMHWYVKAKDKDVEANVLIGQLYEKGRGVEKDSATAMTWYEKGAEAGSSWGQLKLGNIYRDLRDYEEALKWFKRSRNKDASVHIGVMYAKGLGVAKSSEEAIKWYKKGADAGSAWGQGLLERMNRQTGRQGRKEIKHQHAGREHSHRLPAESGLAHQHGEGAKGASLF